MCIFESRLSVSKSISLLQEYFHVSGAEPTSLFKNKHIYCKDANECIYSAEVLCYSLKTR
jgi:hypothetical protein